MKNLEKIKEELIREILESKPTGFIGTPSTLVTIADEIMDTKVSIDFKIEIDEWEGDIPVLIVKEASDDFAPAMEFDDIPLTDMDWNMITEIHNLIK
jgi:hypothetical protein